MTRAASDLEPHRRHLFGVCYRMTGVAADAEDLVQQTFARALESPPERTVSLRPWLTRVAVNLARDQLRARKRRGYVGPFLPSPIALDELGLEADDEPLVPAHEPHGEARYELLESVSFAFLLALEALTPTQRAVLILRDVFDYSVRETAQALSLSEANVKVTHHRARSAMARYDEDRRGPRAPKEVARLALQAFVGAIASQDVEAIEKLLRADCVTLNDGGGEFFAARSPVVGAAKVALFHKKIAAHGAILTGLRVVELNGDPALVLEYQPGDARLATLSVLRVEVDADGRIAEVHGILASRKLTHVPRAA